MRTATYPCIHLSVDWSIHLYIYQVIDWLTDLEKVEQDDGEGEEEEEEEYYEE